MASGESYQIKPLDSIERIRAAVALQQEVWGFSDLELLPVRLFVTARKIGGQGFGAFDGDRLIGFCLAIPGVKPGGTTYLHSHMLAVLPGYRNAGIGRALKLHQREDALARGIQLMEWTFDPLELKNAYFNIERLGAIVRRFTRNQYGTTSSRLHAGLPTDRCTAEWWMASDRVNSVLAGNPVNHGEIVARIEIPLDLEKDRAGIQAAASAQFERYLDAGLAVIGFEKSPTTGTYLLGEYK